MNIPESIAVVYVFVSCTRWLNDHRNAYLGRTSDWRRSWGGRSGGDDDHPRVCRNHLQHHEFRGAVQTTLGIHTLVAFLNTVGVILRSALQ